MSQTLCKFIKKRIYDTLNFHQPKEQPEFRKKFSMIDQIFTINQILEKTREFEMPLRLMFIDYNKATKHAIR